MDTSGYSTGVQAKYQAYFITEVPLKVGGKNLPAGIYGVGFVGDKFLVTDVGAHDVLMVATADDAGLKRPMPLQVVADPAGGFRLYAQTPICKLQPVAFPSSAAGIRDSHPTLPDNLLSVLQDGGMKQEIPLRPPKAIAQGCLDQAPPSPLFPVKL